MRLLFLNRSFAPDVEATGQLLGELCADLAGGHDVAVVAGRPNHGPRSPSWLPVRCELSDSVRVYRIHNPQFDKRSLASRGIGLTCYFLGAALVTPFLRRPDVIVVETDPPMLGLLGALLKRWHGARMVYYLQDLFPEVGLAMGRLKPGWLTNLLRWTTQVGLRSADHVIVLGEDMRRKVLARGATSAVSIVPNWIDTRLVQPLAPTATLRSAWGLDDRLLVAYSGNLGWSQSLDVVLAAAEAMANEPIQFVLIGEGAAKSALRDHAAKRSLQNVSFLPYQPKELLGASLGTADVHLIPMKKGLAGCLVPSKLYGILAAGRPYVAAVDDDCDVAHVTREHQTGLVIPPDDAGRLVEALRWCIHHPAELSAMGMRGRRLAETTYDRRAAVRRFDHVLRTVLGERERCALARQPGIAN